MGARCSRVWMKIDTCVRVEDLPRVLMGRFEIWAQCADQGWVTVARALFKEKVPVGCATMLNCCQPTLQRFRRGRTGVHQNSAKSDTLGRQDFMGWKAHTYIADRFNATRSRTLEAGYTDW